ncbi:MAG: RHS repeat-associated core domain-containing protein [Deltaproteobacteria bacterium]
MTTYNFGRTPTAQNLLGSGSITIPTFNSAGLPAVISATQSGTTDTWGVDYDGVERPVRIQHTAAAYGSRAGVMTLRYCGAVSSVCSAVDQTVPGAITGPLLSQISWGTTPGQTTDVAFDYEPRTLRVDRELITNEGLSAEINYTYAPTAIGTTGTAMSATFARNGASSSWTLSIRNPSTSGTPLTYGTSVLTVDGVAANATSNRATQFGESYESVTGTTTNPWFIERICTRDGHGRVTARSEWVRTGTNAYQWTRYTYGYDGAGRLTSTARYRTDPVTTPAANACPTSGGTLVTASNRTWTYNDAGTRSDLTAGTDDQITTGGRLYDVRGRMSKSGTASIFRTYTRDVQGRLRQSVSTIVGVGSTTTTFEYDPLGRLSHIDPNGTPDDADDQYFWYRDGLRPIAWQRGVGATAVHAFFVYVTRRNVPDLMYVDNAGTTAIDAVYRLITDERGSVRAVLQVNGTASIVQRVSYDEWGIDTVEVGANTLHPFGFAGGIRMGSTGLWHFGARDYSPFVGQWIQKDPIEYGGGSGLYLYCENDPVNYVDPDGRNPILVGALTGGIASFIISVGLHSLDGSLCGDLGSILDDTAMGIVSGALFGWFLPGATGMGGAFFGQGSAGSRLFGGALAGAASNVGTTAIGDALGSSPTGRTYAASAALGVAGGIGSVGLAPSLLGRGPANLSWGAGTGATGRALNADIAHYALASELWGFLGGAPGNLPAE